MKRLVPVIAFIVLAGCNGGPDPTPTATFTGAPGVVYLTDPVDSGIEPPYDLIRVDFRELNGSVVMRLEFVDFTQGDDFVIPEFLARFTIEGGAGPRDFYALNKPRSPGSASVKWVLGETVDGQDREIEELCTVTSVIEPPYTMEMDLLNNRTGLLYGGTLKRLSIKTADFQGHDKDSASAEKDLAFEGGPNPHGACPLLAERSQQQ